VCPPRATGGCNSIRNQAAGGACGAIPNPLAGFKGPYFQGKGVQGYGKEGIYERKGKGEGKGRGGGKGNFAPLASGGTDDPVFLH